MTIDADTLAQLKAVAEAATEGPWKPKNMPVPAIHDGNAPYSAVVTDNSDEWIVCTSTMPNDPDLQHIATFDPPMVAALMDEIDHLREQVAAMGDRA